jgi:hypothetical protein
MFEKLLSIALIFPYLVSCQSLSKRGKPQDPPQSVDQLETCQKLDQGHFHWNVETQKCEALTQVKKSPQQQECEAKSAEGYTWNSNAETCESAAVELSAAEKQKECESRTQGKYQWNAVGASCEEIEQYCSKQTKAGSLMRKSFSTSVATSKDGCKLVDQTASCDNETGKVSWPEKQIYTCNFEYDAYVSNYIIASQVLNQRKCAQTKLKASITLDKQDAELKQQKCDIKTPESFCLISPESNYFHAGNGSNLKPFVICQASHLQWLEYFGFLRDYIEVAGYNAILGKDIDGPTVDVNEYYELGFHLDGNGKKILVRSLRAWTKGLPTMEYYTGIFKKIRSGSIENLTIECPQTLNIALDEPGYYQYAGILSGEARNSNFANITVNCNITVTANSSTGRDLSTAVGWLIGNSIGNKFSGINFTGTITPKKNITGQDFGSSFTEIKPAVK